MWRILFLSLLCSLFLSGCVPNNNTNVPVFEVNPYERLPQNGIHRVLPQETLYSIAWRYGFDYRMLAQWNHIQPPYHIHAGQIIVLKSRQSLPKKTIVLPKKSFVQQTIVEKEPVAAVQQWLWPATGPVIDSFSSLNKGINIGGQIGTPIVAAAAGKVVYSGHGLRGYGNLIIIKHNSSFLTAYAHNSRIFIHEGDWVTLGQKIAEMGNTGTQRTMLHFEIRRNGKPVNPLLYLRPNAKG